MLSFIIRRILYSIPLLFIISILIFFIIQLPPGDYATWYVSQTKALANITQEQAINAVAAANVAGLENINGVYGYQKGDAIPGVKDGIMDSKGVGRNVATGALTGHYSDIESFIGRMSMSRADKDKADFNASFFSFLLREKV